MAVSRRAVFFDKDGTLITNVPHNVDPDRIHLAPSAREALRSLSARDYALFVVTNQSGVAHGLFAEQALVGVQRRVAELMSREGRSLQGFYYCPHSPDGTVRRYAFRCPCRKPAPGLLFAAADEHRIELEESWMIGDILDDVEAGNRAGCRTILIDNGGETEWLVSAWRRPIAIVRDLLAAATFIQQFDERSCHGAARLVSDV